LLLTPDPFSKGGRRLFRPYVLSFAIPVILCGLAVAAYNYSRFDNPLEFGTRYLLGGDAYRNFHLSANLTRGLYYLLICPPDLLPEFPFVRLALRQPFAAPPVPINGTFSSDYFLEPIAGVLSLCPILLLMPLLWLGWGKLKRGSPAFATLAAMFVSACGAILVIASVPFSSHRYEADFAPYLLFVACVVAGVALQTLRRKPIRRIAVTGLAVLLLYCITANLALAIQGPYDQFVQANPRSYVELARWFSPVQRFRPMLNPVFRARAVFQFPETCDFHKEPLLSLGEFGSRYLLSAECGGPREIRLISESSIRHPDVLSVSLPFAAPGLYAVGWEFSPKDLTMTVTWNGAIVMRHPLRFLVTARSQILFGEDPTLGNPDTFVGRIQPSPPELFASATRK
jgi:hypothetical protein